MLRIVSRRECLEWFGVALAGCCPLGWLGPASAQVPKGRSGGELQPKILNPAGGVERLAVTPGGRWLVAGCKEDTRLWDLKADDPSAKSLVVRGSAGPVSPDGRWLMTAGIDRTIRLWDLKAKDPSAECQEVARFEASWQPLRGVAVNPDNRWLVTAGGDRVLRLWELKAQGKAAQSQVLMERHEGTLLTPDGRWLVAGGRTPGAVGVWDLGADDPAATALMRKMKDKGYTGPQGISPDGRWLVGVTPERRLWDLRAKDPFARHVAEFGGTEHVRSLDFSSDSRWLVTGGDDGLTRLYDLQATDPGSKPLELGGHAKGESVGEVRFSPNGRWLVTGGRDETARLWDMKTIGDSPKSAVLRGHTNWVEFLAVSPNNRWLVTGASVANGEFDRAARLWDLETADPTAVHALLEGHGGSLQDAIFSLDGRWLVTRASDKTARLWDLKAAKN